MSEERFGQARRLAAGLCREAIMQHTATLISAANAMESRVSPGAPHGKPTAGVRAAQVELLKAVQLGLDNCLLRSDIREAIMEVVRESDTLEEAQTAVYQVIKTIGPVG